MKKVTIKCDLVPQAVCLHDGTTEEALAKMRGRLREAFQNAGVHPSKLNAALDKVMAHAQVVDE